jgi:type III secretion system FlhB-like substrate exporter
MARQKKVVALSFAEDTLLPQVVFNDSGLYAERFETEFRKTHAATRVIQDPELLQRLAVLPVNSAVSPDLYQLVAMLIVHVFSAEALLKRSSL